MNGIYQNNYQLFVHYLYHKIDHIQIDSSADSDNSNMFYSRKTIRDDIKQKILV